MSRSCYKEVLPHIQHPWLVLKANEGERENLIIAWPDAAFLLAGTFLSSVSDTLWAEKKMIFRKTGGSPEGSSFIQVSVLC